MIKRKQLDKRKRQRDTVRNILKSTRKLCLKHDNKITHQDMKLPSIKTMKCLLLGNTLYTGNYNTYAHNVILLSH